MRRLEKAANEIFENEGELGMLWYSDYSNE